jgi:arginase
MPVATVLGVTPAPMKQLLGNPVPASRFSYYGVRVGEEAELAFRNTQKLRTLQTEQKLSGPVHVHFDLDVLDPIEFPHLSYPEPGGLSVDRAIDLIAGIAAQADMVGLTITEFAPANQRGAREGQAVIERICKAATASAAS